MSKRILIVDDAAFMRMMIKDILTKNGFEVVGEAADGEWYYVFNQVCGGWVRREMVAVCKSREEWVDRQSFDKFIVVTGRELKVSEDPYFEEMAGVLLPMGTNICWLTRRHPCDAT